MHGRIASVAVAEGDEVEAGQLLFTLEAMKMEHSVLAPLAGRIARVAVTPGQQVEQGLAAVSIVSETAE